VADHDLVTVARHRLMIEALQGLPKDVGAVAGGDAHAGTKVLCHGARPPRRPGWPGSLRPRSRLDRRQRPTAPGTSATRRSPPPPGPSPPAHRPSIRTDTV